MSTIEQTTIPTGTWAADPVHSTFGFAVKHNVVATFRGRFTDVEATIADGVLSGTAKVESLAIDEQNLKGHLLSPDFFDAAQFPEVSFASRSVAVEGTSVTVDGELTLRGVTRPVTLTGEINGPVTDAYGGERLGLELDTTVDRTAFGLEWNAPLPGGGFILANDVKLHAELEFTKAA